VGGGFSAGAGASYLDPRRRYRRFVLDHVLTFQGYVDHTTVQEANQVLTGVRL